MLLLDPVVLPERDGVGVPAAVAVLVPLGVCVAGGDTDGVAEELPVRLSVAAGLPVGVPVALDVGVRVPDTDAVEDKLAVAVAAPVAVVLLEAPTEPVLVIELVRLPVTLGVVVPVAVEVAERVLVAVEVAEPVLVAVEVAEPVLVDVDVGESAGFRMHTLTLRTAIARRLDGRMPIVMTCVPLRKKMRVRVTQPVPPFVKSSAVAFHST